MHKIRQEGKRHMAGLYSRENIQTEEESSCTGGQVVRDENNYVTGTTMQIKYILSN